MNLKFFLSCLLFSSISFAQSPKRIFKKIGDKPIIFIDSINADYSQIAKFEANEIASFSVFKGKDATDLMGEEGKDGVIYIETKKFAKIRYWNYFKSKSPEYFNLVPNLEKEPSVQYVLNDKILTDNFEANLASINDEIFKGITIISKDELVKKYNIENKDFGVLIKSDTPDNLHHGNKKF